MSSDSEPAPTAPPDPPGPNGSATAELRRRLDAARPGDTLHLARGESRTIETVLLCSETIAGETTQWRWIFLDDRSLLESAPKGSVLYAAHRVLGHATRRYRELVAQDGALVRFEARVRAGTWARRPVQLTVDGTRYRIAYTGTVAAQRLGAEPPCIPWRALRPDPAKNVYFGLASADGRPDVVLGLWTDDVCLSFGRPLNPSELALPHGSQPPPRTPGRS